MRAARTPPPAAYSSRWRLLSRVGYAHDGEVSTRLGLSGIPVAAETVALFTYLELAHHHRRRTHHPPVLRGRPRADRPEARADGVSCDVSINHVHLCDMDIGYFDPNCHLIPPLRMARPQSAGPGLAGPAHQRTLCASGPTRWFGGVK